MEKRSRFRWTLFFLIYWSLDSKAQDTTLTSTYLQTSLATSYSAQSNWQGQDYKNLSFAGSFNYRHQLQKVNWRHQHMVLADLSFLKFIDSLWLKNNDRLQVSLLWNDQQKKILHSYSVQFQTQFLPTYQYGYDYELRKTNRTKMASTFNPSALELGYGAVWNFWETSNINFAFATMRFTTLPRNANMQMQDLPHFAKTDNTYLNLSYGFALTTNIRKQLGDRVEWWNNSRVFCNAADKDHITFEFNNRINVKLWKFLQLRFETKLGYNPAMNYQIQFGQEVLLGMFFERQK